MVAFVDLNLLGVPLLITRTGTDLTALPEPPTVAVQHKDVVEMVGRLSTLTHVPSISLLYFTDPSSAVLQNDVCRPGANCKCKK
jgi:hypothetical protein